MAPDEYSTGGGGKLKLKGSKVADGRVEKKKKKKEKKEMKERESGQEVKDGSGDDVKSQEKPGSPEYERGQGEGGPKTETEKKYEEMRRKRVCALFFSFFEGRLSPELNCVMYMLDMLTGGYSCVNDSNGMASRPIRNG